MARFVNLVDPTLESGQYFGGELHFVEDQRPGKIVEEEIPVVAHAIYVLDRVEDDGLGIGKARYLCLPGEPR